VPALHALFCCHRGSRRLSWLGGHQAGEAAACPPPIGASFLGWAELANRPGRQGKALAAGHLAVCSPKLLAGLQVTTVLFAHSGGAPGKSDFQFWEVLAKSSKWSPPLLWGEVGDSRLWGQQCVCPLSTHSLPSLAVSSSVPGLAWASDGTKGGALSLPTPSRSLSALLVK
jgi:hypothetical protein